MLVAISAPTESQRQLSESELRERLASLEVELLQEQERLESIQQEEISTLEGIRMQRSELASDVLEFEMQLQELQELERILTRSLNRQRETIRSAPTEQEAHAMMDQARSLAEQMDIHLGEIPTPPQWREEVQRLIDGAEAVRNPQQRWEYVLAVLEAFDRAHEHASMISVERRTLRTADGRQEDVDLLNIGHIGFAYRTVEDGRIGITLRSPEDAHGYRWYEGAPTQYNRKIEAAIQQIHQGETGRVALPIDITQRLRAEVALEDAGWLGVIRSGGLVMVPLGGVAFLALILIVERLITLSKQGTHLGKTHEALLAVKEGEYEKAMRICEGSSGVTARVMAACLKQRERGQHAMEDSIQEQMFHEMPMLNRFFSGLAILGAVAPLLGLLGTVTGIIQTFGVITAHGAANASMMAGGISEALITTAAGLSIAIPILLLHCWLSSRADGLICDAEKHAATLLNIVSNAKQ